MLNVLLLSIYGSCFSLTFLQSFCLNLRSDLSDIQAHEFRGFESTFMACCELRQIVDGKNTAYSCSQLSALGINQLTPVLLGKKCGISIHKCKYGAAHL